MRTAPTTIVLAKSNQSSQKTLHNQAEGSQSHQYNVNRVLAEEASKARQSALESDIHKLMKAIVA